MHSASTRWIPHHGRLGNAIAVAIAIVERLMLVPEGLKKPQRTQERPCVSSGVQAPAAPRSR
eukprot:9479093-Pyramimonas_sp.AAC.1